MNLFLPQDYQKNPGKAFVDTWEDSKDYQFWVYHESLKYITEDTRYCDLGCGYGWKLRYWIEPKCADITGFDLPEAVEYCWNQHNFGEWMVLDLNSEPLLEVKFDVIICADVIEHLVNPDACLQHIKNFAHLETVILLSTPDRALVRGADNLGPPENPHHIQEWTQEELMQYVASHGFNLVEAKHVSERKSTKGPKTCQLLVLKV